MGFQRGGRREGTRRYRSICYFVCEGEVTEREYVENVLRPVFGSRCMLKCLDRPHSAIEYLIRRAQEEQERLDDEGQEGEIWILLDQDLECHSPEQFSRLHDWTSEDPKRRRVGLSVPTFEFWLWLHFEDTSFSDSNVDQRKIATRIKDYGKRKGIKKNLFTRRHLESAVAKHQGHPFPQARHFVSNREDAPRKGSGVAILVKELLELDSSKA